MQKLIRTCTFLLLAAELTIVSSYNNQSWSEWSVCTHSCNGGVKSQDCLSGNCTQTTIQYSSCNVQNCPVFMGDIRDQQCTRDVNKYIPSFSHMTWKAEKYGRVGDLCELFCTSEDGKYQINPPIDEGTPCKGEGGWEGRCLGKMCGPIGCDGILGSNKRLNNCHRCAKYSSDGTNEDCEHFSNSVTIKDHRQTVISFIPIHSTSIIINYTHHIDLMTLSDSHHFPTNLTEVILNGNSFVVREDGTLYASGPLTQVLTIMLNATSDTDKPSVDYEYHMLVQSIGGDSGMLDTNGTFTWKYGGFGPCTATCSGGVQVSHVHCQDSAFPGKIMPDKFCWETSKPFPIVKKCFMADCPARWETSDWGVCSTKCAQGTRYRDVKCWKKKGDGSDFYVPDAECANLPKPATSEPCNIRPCGTQWKAFDWSTCSRRCGLGISTRSVICIDESSQSVDELYCLEEVEKPASIKPCDEGPCYYSWYTSEWSQCSQLCGEGLKTRVAYCSDQNTIPVDDHKCSNLTKPVQQQSCYEVTGCFASWDVGAWGLCQGPCDTAQQARVVECYVFIGNQSERHPGMCDNTTRPTGSRKCPEHECAHWTVGEWEKCSADCGPGIMQRGVTCLKGGNPSNDCNPNVRPPNSAPCEIKPCTDCLDNPKMNCEAMKANYGCNIDFIRQICCETCS